MSDAPQVPVSSTPETAVQPGTTVPPPASTENRAAVRVNITWKAKIMMPQGAVIEAKTADVSATGIGLVGHHPFPVHSVLQVAIQVPHPTISGSFTVITGRVKVAFQVMRGGDYRTGVQFVELSEAYKALINVWVERVVASRNSK